MAVSKVILNGNTLIDTTQKTVTASKMLSGETALNNAGEDITGNIATKTSSNMTVSGATVTAPAGYYASNASKSVASGSATPAATISATGASVSTGTNTLTLSKSVSNTPTVTSGYVSSGTAGNSSVSLTASVTTQAAQTIHPSTSDQTIASGRYLTGTQTVKAVKLTNLSASNIVSGVTVKVGDSTDDDCVTSVTGTASSGGSTTIEALNVTTNGTYTAPSGKAYSPVTVNVSGGGGGSAEEKQVNFIDYDGTILYSYTATEANALTALPSNPSHSGLTAQGWNWTLAQIKAQLTAMPDGSIWVGQMYITSDGKTRIYCHFETGRLAPYLGLGVNGTVVVDWGDNSTTKTLTGTSLTTVQTAQHTYMVAGDYTITLTVSSGKFAFFGASSGAYNTAHILKKGTSITANINSVYSNAVRRVEFGHNANIGNYAFCNCGALKSITIPDEVTSIGTDAFYGCYGLASITVPDGVTSIGSNAFRESYGLASITIPDGVTSIGNAAFYSCWALQSITIPDGVTSIGSSAFYNCGALRSITIPDGVTSIGSNVFTACRSLTSITIPDEVTSIGSDAFRECGALQFITIPDGVTSIGSNAFSSCRCLASITIPDGVTSIENAAFSYCCALTSITIPDGVTSIENAAFSSCYALTSITIPDEVTSIGSNAFSSCLGLASITIPDGVTSIGNAAFRDCYGMAEYHLLPTTPPTLGSTDPFRNIQSDCVIYVPYSADHSILTAYQTATNWSTYASKMQEEPQ